MRVLEHRALRGPNRYHLKPMVVMRLDIEDLEEHASNEIPGFVDRLLGALPGLRDHHCGQGHEGGFVARLHRGTWAAHVVEHVALELQARAGSDVRYGKTRMTRERGVYTVAYRYADEDAGLEAGRIAVDVVDALVAGRAVDVEGLVARVSELTRQNQPGPSTAAILDAARRRGIPVTWNPDADFIQLGYGARLHRLQATITSRTGLIGVELADDKARTKRFLREAGVPVPEGRVVGTLEDAHAAARDLGYPVVVKPRVGNHGRGITVGVRGSRGLARAFEAAARVNRDVVLERVLPGADHRVLVVNHRFVAAARRDPAHVTGDGRSTVRALIDAANADPRRGDGHESVLTRIHVDAETERLLEEQGLELNDVPDAGERVLLKRTANLSTGGTATDVTEDVHPAVRALAERVSRLVGLDVCGLDVVAPDLTRPLHESGGGVVEVNAAPGLRMHLAPSAGAPRDVAANIIDALFPRGDPGRIPIVAITGTNGKTTTASLVRHVLRDARDATVGMATTTGVTIGDHEVVGGDYSGPSGAATVLGDPAVDHAVLEVARGGLIRRGLAFDACDVGVFLNVGPDHLGEGDVEDVEELAHVKAVVIEAVREGGAAVLNAEDPLVMKYAGRTPGDLVLFALDATHDAFRAHGDAGGVGVTVEDGFVVIVEDGTRTPVIAVADVPLTFGGRARFNVQNVLATVAATHALGVPAHAIGRALRAFRADARTLPGRMNVLDVDGVRVVVDYGHNVPAVEALAEMLPHLDGDGRRLNVASGSGNRTDEDLDAFGRAVAALYDHVIVCDPDPRGRPLGETAERVADAVASAGGRVSSVDIVLGEAEAVDTALGMARPGDLVVLQVADVPDTLDRVRRAREAASAATEEPAPDARVTESERSPYQQ